MLPTLTEASSELFFVGFGMPTKMMGIHLGSFFPCRMRALLHGSACTR
jgi:hypothetical protein